MSTDPSLPAAVAPSRSQSTLLLTAPIPLNPKAQQIQLSGVHGHPRDAHGDKEILATIQLASVKLASNNVSCFVKDKASESKIRCNTTNAHGCDTVAESHSCNTAKETATIARASNINTLRCNTTNARSCCDTVTMANKAHSAPTADVSATANKAHSSDSRSRRMTEATAPPHYPWD